MPPYSGPRPETIRKNLGNLIREGLLSDWINEVGGELLTLECVQAKASGQMTTPEAVIAVIEDAVKRLASERHRRVLGYVFPLPSEHPGLLGESAKTRRIAAGDNYRGLDGKRVTWGTIRTHHERKALDALAPLVIALEAAHRGEDLPIGA